MLWSFSLNSCLPLPAVLLCELSGLGLVKSKRACEEVAEPPVLLQEVAGESGVFGVSDDQNRQSRRICSLLSKVPNQTLLESELKQQLGFKYAPLSDTQVQNRQVPHQRSL